MGFLLYLFLAYAVAILIGRAKDFVPEALVKGLVMCLIFTISFWGSGEVYSQSFIKAVILSFLFALSTFSATYSLGFMWKGRFKPSGSAGFRRGGLIYLVPLALGYVAGLFFKAGALAGEALQAELLALVFMVGVKLGGSISLNAFKSSWRTAFASTLTSVLGALLSSLALSAFLEPLGLSLSIAFGFGWYTLDGPLVAQLFGPAAGAEAFLANFFREQLTFALVPLLSKLGRNPEGLLAAGGATTMDTTLGLFGEALGKDYYLASTVNGLLLSLIVPVAVPVAARL